MHFFSTCSHSILANCVRNVESRVAEVVVCESMRIDRSHWFRQKRHKNTNTTGHQCGDAGITMLWKCAQAFIVLARSSSIHTCTLVVTTCTMHTHAHTHTTAPDSCIHIRISNVCRRVDKGKGKSGDCNDDKHRTNEIM